MGVHWSARKTTFLAQTAILSLVASSLIQCILADAGSHLQAGDQAVSRGEFTAAIKHYSDFITADPKAPLGYTKRAAAYLQQRKNDAALQDLNLALEVDHTFLQGYLHRGRLLRQTCQFFAAIADFTKILEIKPGHAAAEKELKNTKEAEESLKHAKEWLERDDVSNAKAHLEQVVLLHSPDCLEARLLKSEILLGEKDYSGVVAETGKVLKADENELRGLLLRGKGYFYLGDHELALRHYQKGLRSDPEHIELKKEYRKVKNLEKKTKAAEEALAKSKLRAAADEFQSALLVDPDHSAHNVKLFLGLCKTLVKLSRGKDALQACSSALEIDEELVEALTNRAEAHIILEELDAAVVDYKAARELAPQDHTVAQGLMKAEKLLKISKRKDWYKVLNIDKNADSPTIKKAYKRLALQWHPDKNVGNQEEAESRFREIAEAYEVLGDEEKRGRYDRGEDEEPQGHPGGGFNPFGGGGGHTFHFQYGGQGGDGFPGGGFPGGFGGFG